MRPSLLGLIWIYEFNLELGTNLQPIKQLFKIYKQDHLHSVTQPSLDPTEGNTFAYMLACRQEI